MNELNTNFLSMTSQEISELTGKTISHINRDIKSMLEQLKDSEPNLDSMYKSVTYKQKVGFGERNNTMYYLNKELTYTLITGYSVKLRNAIIVRWQELEQAITPRTPITYLEALKELVAITEQKEQLEAQNRALMHTLNTYTSTQIAKELQFKSANEFNQALHSKGIQYKQNGTWLLYAKYANMGLVEIKQGIKNEHTYYNTHWTQKGRQFLLALFDKIKETA